MFLRLESITPLKLPPIEPTSTVIRDPLRVTEVAGMLVALWSGLSSVASRPSLVLKMWNTTFSVLFGVLSVPSHVPSISEGFAGLACVTCRLEK